MKRLALLGALALAVAIGGSTRASAAAGGGAVFVETNELAGNNVVSYSRAPDGSLTWAGTFATGGLGGAQDGAVVDKLASQGALALDANDGLLFAVMPAVVSLSVFSVDGTNLRRRQVIGTNGNFPSSLAVRGNLVYVLNAGGAGSVQGFRITGNHLSTLHDGWRSWGFRMRIRLTSSRRPGK